MLDECWISCTKWDATSPSSTNFWVPKIKDHHFMLLSTYREKHKTEQTGTDWVASKRKVISKSSAKSMKGTMLIRLKLHVFSCCLGLLLGNHYYLLLFTNPRIWKTGGLVKCQYSNIKKEPMVWWFIIEQMGSIDVDSLQEEKTCSNSSDLWKFR